MCSEIRPSRRAIKSGSGVPTVPVSSNHQDGTWLATDIYPAEQYMDTDTGLVYTRNGATIKQVAPTLNMTVLNIGDWDMVTDATATVSVGSLSEADIRSVDVLIISDSGVRDRLELPNGGYTFGIGTGIVLGRSSGGAFDNSSYDSTSFNRGYITIWHT